MSAKKSAAAEEATRFSNLLDVTILESPVGVCLASVNKDPSLLPIFERLQLSEELTDTFRHVASDLAQDWRKKLETSELVVRPYDVGSKPDAFEVEYVNLGEYKYIGDQINSLSSLASLPVFSMADDFLSGLRFYVIVVQRGQAAPLYLFRSYTPKKELGRSTFFGALLSGGQFNRVRQPLFLFDHFIDCLSSNNDMFVFKKNNFQAIFRFFELVLQSARETLQTIKERVPIANFEGLQKASESNIPMLTKLKNIAGKPYLERITMRDIKKVLKAFPALRVEIIREDGKEKLLYDPIDRWAILRLLDDDYLSSIMTGQQYEVTGKRQY